MSFALAMSSSLWGVGEGIVVVEAVIVVVVGVIVVVGSIVRQSLSLSTWQTEVRRVSVTGPAAYVVDPLTALPAPVQRYEGEN